MVHPESVVASENPVNSSLRNRIILNACAQPFFRDNAKVSDSSHCKIWSFIERISDVQKLFRITAFYLRFLLKLRKGLLLKDFQCKEPFWFAKLKFFKEVENPSNAQLTTTELENAKLLWVHRIHAHSCLCPMMLPSFSPSHQRIF